MNAQATGIPQVCHRKQALAAMWKARSRLVPFFVAEEPDTVMLELVRGIDDDLVEIAQAVNELAANRSDG